MLIGLYRDVWIAAIASSRTRLATLTGAMCKTSQCELRSLRVNSGMLNVIRTVTYYTLPPLESPDSFWIAMAISRYRPIRSRIVVPISIPSHLIMLSTKVGFNVCSCQRTIHIPPFVFFVYVVLLIPQAYLPLNTVRPLHVIFFAFGLIRNELK